MEDKLIWEPNPRQAEFLSIPDTVFEALYGGQAGGGKSDCLLNLPIARKFFEHPKFKGIIFRRTFPELERELINRSHAQKFYESFGGKYNQGRKRWEFKSGAIVAFGHMEYDRDASKYDSDEYNYIAFDELTTFSEYQYKYLYSRCRTSTKDLPAIIRAGTNPGNVGNLWVRDYFVEPAREGGQILVDKVTGLKRIFVPASMEDNPHLMEADPTYRAKLMSMPERDRRAKLGDWWIFGGQSFPEFHDLPNEKDSDNGKALTDEVLHVIKAFVIPDWWPRFLAVDWGFAANTVALWGALSPDHRLYIYRERVWTGTKINEWATEIGRLTQGEKITRARICKSACQQRGDADTVQEQVIKFSKIPFELTENAKGSRIAGKILIQEYLRYKQKPELKLITGEFNSDEAQRILRLQGIDAYKEYIKSFLPTEPEKNLPKLQIFECCNEVRKTFPLCIDDKDNLEDVAEFKGDDAYDDLRYLVDAAESYRTEHLQGRQEIEVKKAEVFSSLAQGGDMTSFYRRMEAIDRKSKISRVGPTRPYRRRRNAA